MVLARRPSRACIIVGAGHVPGEQAYKPRPAGGRGDIKDAASSLRHGSGDDCARFLPIDLLPVRVGRRPGRHFPIVADSLATVTT